jgi:transposase
LARRKAVLDVQRWAEIRRMKEVDGLSIDEIVRRTGHDRNTVRRALRREGPPHYARPPRPSKLDPFKEEIKRLLQNDARIPGKRIRELIEALGYDGGKTILDDCLRELRPLYERRRTYQRTVYRPGELMQFDLFEPKIEIAVGHCQTRRGYVVTAELGYSRAVAGALVFSKEWPDLLFGMSRCLSRLGALPGTLVWDREGAIHAGGGRPSDAFARFCGELRVGWLILEPRDPEAKGALERSHRFMRTNFEPGRSFANELDFQLQLDEWCARVNARVHRTTRAASPSAWPKNASGCGRCLRGCPTQTGAACSASRSSPSCASTQTTTRSTRGSPAGASRSRSARPRSAPSRSTQASSPAATGAASRAS